MLMAIAQMTWRKKRLYSGLNDQIKVTITNSTITSQKPRFMRKRLTSFFDFFCVIRNTEVPARKTKSGAQKWVIHLVKNKAGVVVAILVGLVATDARPAVIAPLDKKKRARSRGSLTVIRHPKELTEQNLDLAV